LILTFCFCGFSSVSDLALIHAKIYPSPADPPIEDGTILIRGVAAHIFTARAASSTIVGQSRKEN
jgi:hypothetical protein